MPRLWMAAALCLFGVPVSAQSLQGQWHLTVPIHPNYMGTILIDDADRVILDGTYRGNNMSFRGYIARKNSVEFRASLTDGTEVIGMFCSIQSSELLHCYSIWDAGRTRGYDLILTRVGAGPRNLADSAVK